MLDLELSVLKFMRSLRASNFVLYVQSIKVLLPSFFLLDNYYYTRWLSIHLLDVRELPTKIPEIAQAFALGKFTTKKTIDMFYRSIALDQVHDQIDEQDGQGRGKNGRVDREHCSI